jgi:LCP family protein required for cell wall assembly
MINIPPPPQQDPPNYPPPTTSALPPDSLDSPLRERARRRERQRKAGADWAWVVIAGVLLGIVVLVGFVMVVALRASAQTADEFGLDLAALPTPVDARIDYTGQTPRLRAGSPITLDDGSQITLTPWDSESRVTVLLMGLDRRPGESGLTYRTDSIMVVSYDPAANSLGILSIPRDLYVSVPGYSAMQRVNTALVLGELQSPGAGAQLAMQTIQYNLGIRVHESIIVDFEAFITLVDAVGGIQLDVVDPIYDDLYPDMYGGYDPFYIDAGVQTLDGLNALKYARTRHNDSDFERARRQQAVVFAIRDQVLNFDRLPSLIVQSPSLLASLNQNVYTTLTLQEIIQLALVLPEIPRENIRTGVIDANYITNFTTGDGAAVLVPLRERLGGLMTDVFGADYSQ